MLTTNFFFRDKLSEDNEKLSGDSELLALTGGKTNIKRAIIEQINFCLDHPHLLNVYDSESGVEMTKAISNALKQGVYGGKQKS